MPGFTETLIIAAIILGIVMLPRILRRPPEPEVRLLNRSLKLNGWKRMAIVASGLWILFFALYLRPWANEADIFIYVGLGPVVLSWGIFWILLGFRKKGR